MTAASMRWTFSNVYTKVSEYLGTGSSPTGTNLTRAKDIVYRGYMKFLMPVTPKDEEIYIWSWLRQPWKITMEPNKWEYPLPLDFDRFYRRLQFDAEETSLINMTQTSEREIMRSRNLLEFNSYPQKYALRTAKYDRKVGSVKELIVYPTPTARTIINSTYVMTPEKPTGDDHFFIGGPMESETILQCCIAVAENEQDERIGVETKKAIDLIQALIRKDKGVAPDTVGVMRDANISQVSIFDYRKYWIPKGTYTVYGQEI